jgi:hypothetical protein
MKTNDDVSTPDNTVEFRAFAPLFTFCPCRACAHRKKSLLRSFDGSVVACAHYRPGQCDGCPLARKNKPDAA